jgi:hypothetical protein
LECANLVSIKKRVGGRRPPRCKNHVGFPLKNLSLWCSWCSHFGSEYFIFSLFLVSIPARGGSFLLSAEGFNVREFSAAHVRSGVKARPRRRARVSPSPAARRNGFSRVLPPRAAARVFVLSLCGGGEVVLGFSFLCLSFSADGCDVRSVALGFAFPVLTHRAAP